LAPVAIGAAASSAGYQHAFLFIAGGSFVYTAIGLLLPNVKARRAPRRSGERGGFGPGGPPSPPPPPPVVLLLSFVRLWCGTGWQPFYPLYLRDHGFDTTTISTVLSTSSLVATFTALGAAWLARRTSNEVATALTLGFTTLGTALSPFMA